MKWLNREIKFRGKTYDGNWVRGNLVKTPYATYITPQNLISNSTLQYDIDPKTVGQYTGLKAKNKVVYEGDLLRRPPKNEWEKKNYVAYEVYFHDNDCAQRHIGFQMNRTHFRGSICGTSDFIPFLPKYVAELEVIGKVHDILEEGETIES